MKFDSPDCTDSSVFSLEAIGEIKHSADFCSLSMICWNLEMKLQSRRFSLRIRFTMLKGRRRKSRQKYQTDRMNVGLSAVALVGCLGGALFKTAPDPMSCRISGGQTNLTTR